MIALTNDGREAVKEKAQQSYVALAGLRPSDDGLTAEQIREAMWCLKRLMDACDSEIYNANRRR